MKIGPEMIPAPRVFWGFEKARGREKGRDLALSEWRRHGKEN
jgi:hypothetical protein